MRKPSEMFEEMTHRETLYSIQAISNLPSIMLLGIVSNEKAGRIQHVSVAMEPVQRRRDRKFVPGGLRLHQYVNLYFDFWNPMLSYIRKWNQELCILQVADCVLDLDGVVVTDMNAAGSYVRFDTPWNGFVNIDFDKVYARDWRDENDIVYRRNKLVKCAEVLVPNSIGYEYVKAATVYDDVSAQRVRDCNFDRKIIVDCRWFFG